jgi:pimeloyl-ACP methyl ester carboxylesterase
MPFADSGGTRIYYDDRGKGEPVLLCLPGWCVHHTIFVPLAERLSAQHRVLVMDWRGHGRSEPPKWDFGYAEMLADALAVIQAGGAQSVIPIAQAHGGWVGHRVASAARPACPKDDLHQLEPHLYQSEPACPAVYGCTGGDAR